MAEIQITIKDLDNGKFQTTVTPSAQHVVDVMKSDPAPSQAYNVAAIALSAIRKYQLAFEKESKPESPIWTPQGY